MNFSNRASQSMKPMCSGTAAKVDLVLDAPLRVLLSRKDNKAMVISVRWMDPVPAPIQAGDQIGNLVLSLPDEVMSLPLLAANDVDALGFLNRISAAVKYLILGPLRHKDCSIV